MTLVKESSLVWSVGMSFTFIASVPGWNNIIPAPYAALTKSTFPKSFSLKVV